MYNVLVVDDSNESRKNVMAALIPVSDTNEWKDNRITKAKKHYAIEEFSIVGDAIDFVQKKAVHTPDLALLDISFLTLRDEDIVNVGRDPKVEKSTTRGFAIYDILKNKSETILFTAHVNADNSIAREIDGRELLQGTHYLTIVEKDLGINIFSRQIKNALQNVANQLLANANQRDFNEIQPLLHNNNPNLAMILEARFWLDGREFTVQNFFIFKFALDENGENLVPTKDILDYIRTSLIDYFEAPAEPNIPDFRGNWNHDWVHQEITNFRQQPNYTTILNQGINTLAANCALEMLQINHAGQNATIIHHRGIFRNSNIGARPPAINRNAAWSATFRNALILRRVFIGLNALANQPIWAIGINQTKRDLIDFIMDTAGWLNSLENVTYHLTTKLGFSIMENHVDMQRLDTAPHRILQEEYQFVQQFVPLIVERMGNNNPQIRYQAI